MSQGLLPYTVETVERGDTVTGRAGLPLGLETMRARGLDQAIAAHLHVRERQSGCTEAAASAGLKRPPAAAQLPPPYSLLSADLRIC